MLNQGMLGESLDLGSMITRKALQSSIIFVCALLFYGFYITVRRSPSVMGAELMASFSITSSDLGFLSSLFFYSYGLMQIPMGAFYDRFGMRTISLTAISITTLGVLIFALSPNFAIASVSRFILGLSTAAAFIGAIKISKVFFDRRYLSRLTGVVSFTGTMFAMVSTPLLALSVDKIGWRLSNGILFLLGLIILLLMGFLFHHPPQEALNRSTSSSWIQDVRGIIKIPLFGSLTLWCSMLHIPTVAFSDLWSTVFYMEVFQISCAQASTLASILFFGIGIGNLGFAWLWDTHPSKHGILIIASVGTLIGFMACIYLPINFYLTGGFMFVLGLFLGAKVVAFSMIADIASSNSAGTALGIMNALSMIIPAVLQPILGWALDLFDRKYPHVNEYQLVFSIIVVILSLGLLIIRPMGRHLKQQEQVS